MKKQKVKKKKIRFRNGSSISFENTIIETDLLYGGDIDGMIVHPHPIIFED